MKICIVGNSQTIKKVQLKILFTFLHRYPDIYKATPNTSF